jgi:hypothetical protein
LAVVEATTTHQLPPHQANTMHHITIHLSILLRGARVFYFSLENNSSFHYLKKTVLLSDVVLSE